jgi:phage-related protein
VNWLKNIFAKILAAIGQAFGSFFQSEIEVQDNVEKIISNFRKGRQEIIDGIDEVRNFQFNPQWRTRVINVPAAQDYLVGLYDSVFTDFRDKMDTLVAPFHDLALIFRAEHSGAGDPQQAVSGVAKAAVKIDEIATCVKQFADATDTALSFIETFQQILMTLETLEGIFLQQSNPRQLDHLDTGEPIKIRLGNLHQ